MYKIIFWKREDVKHETKTFQSLTSARLFAVLIPGSYQYQIREV